MPRTITYISLPAPQTFNLTLNGLNLNTQLNVYFEGKKLPYRSTVTGTNKSCVYKEGDASAAPTTDSNGTARIVVILGSDYGNLVSYSESSVIKAIEQDSVSKKLVIVDSYSIDSSTLPSDYTTKARCYCSTTITKSVKIDTTVETKTWDFTDPAKDALAGGTLQFETL